MDDFNYKHLLDRMHLSQYETEEHEKIKTINYDRFDPETVIELRECSHDHTPHTAGKDGHHNHNQHHDHDHSHDHHHDHHHEHNFETQRKMFNKKEP